MEDVPGMWTVLAGPPKAVVGSKIAALRKAFELSNQGVPVTGIKNAATEEVLDAYALRAAWQELGL